MKEDEGDRRGLFVFSDLQRKEGKKERKKEGKKLSRCTYIHA